MSTRTPKTAGNRAHHGQRETKKERGGGGGRGRTSYRLRILKRKTSLIGTIVGFRTLQRLVLNFVFLFVVVDVVCPFNFIIISSLHLQLERML